MGWRGRKEGLEGELKYLYLSSVPYLNPLENRHTYIHTRRYILSAPYLVHIEAYRGSYCIAHTYTYMLHPTNRDTPHSLVSIARRGAGGRIFLSVTRITSPASGVRGQRCNTNRSGHRTIGSVATHS